MSSTQMDFSPMSIDRKQDIASWPEGEVGQLTTRDTNRYQKRKSAVIEYFQSELSAEEIALRHRLPASEPLEVLVRRCCMFHKDGRLWGFRALVPGTKVIDAASPASSDKEAEKDSSPRVTSTNGHAPVSVQLETTDIALEEEGEDTAEHQAVISTKFAALPQTPIPPTIEEPLEAVEPEAEAKLSNGSDPVEEPLASATEALEVEPTMVEVKHEELPEATSEVETAGEAEVEQEEFPEATNVEAEVEQGTSSEAAHVVEALDDAAVKPEERPEVTSEAGASDDAEVEQEEFPVVAGKVETPTDGEVEQKESPVEATSEAPDKDVEPQEEAPVALSNIEEVLDDAEVEQEEFPEIASVVQAAEEDAVGEEPELPGESTDKLSDLPSEGQPEVQGPSADETEELIDDEDEETQELVAVVSKEHGAERSREIDESAEVAEMDTVEVARVESEKRLDRVAATDTIKVSAAMLDALERADRELQAKAEEPGASIASHKILAEDSVEPHGAQPPEIKEQVEETWLLASSSLTSAEVEAIATQTLGAHRRDGQESTRTLPLKSPMQSLVEEGRYRITGSQMALKRAMFRRWGKQGRERKYRSWVRIVSAAVIVSILVILLIPLGVGLVGYNAYTNIKNVANDGVNNLLSIKDLIPANKNDFMSVLQPQKLNQAKTDLAKAQSDFLQLQDIVNRPDIESLLHQFAPQYSNELGQARRLVQVALDVSQMGQELIGVAQMGANILHGGSLLSSSSTKPLFTADNVNAVEATLVHAQYYINDIQAQMSQVDLATLPFGSKAQKAQLSKYLQEIPQAQGMIAQAQGLVGAVAWVLGVGQARHFLVQTLDRAELRPSGGFEGQYGVLTLQNGRMSPFSLKDITDLDYAENGAELNRLPPPQYSWMNFGNWGVRDANLSADYPTNAQLVMRVFQEEGGGPIDGDIQFTPVVIAQLLRLTGPIYVWEEHDTVTAQNLEDKLHYYQQNFNAISVQREKTGTNNASTRKAFTVLVGKLLLDRVHSLKVNQLMDFSKVLLQDLKTRDLQIYFTNPEAEQWLVQNGYSGAMPQFTNGTDGFMVVQANISISKATQYVHTTFNDQVTLDAQGGATHNLKIILDYNQTGPVYGFDTYTDYMRVYAPANAQFLGGDGFVDPSHALCTPASKKTGTTGGTGGNGGGGTTGPGTKPPVGCGQYNSSYPGDGRYCSSGNYSLGTGYVAGKGFVPWPVYAPSGPTETRSDLTGYKMWGGLTQTPKNCTSTITLSWYVPHVVQKTPGKAPYQMVVGHQAGWPETAQISVDTSALKGVKSFKANQKITVDTLMALPAIPLPPSQKKPVTPTPAVTPTATPKKP